MALGQAFVVPENYTFTPGGIFLHKDAFERIFTLIEQAGNRDPDSHGMYIYNDFFGYAILDLVDGTLSAIHTYVTNKKWADAWYALVALSLFNDVYYDWTNVDDGDRVRVTAKAYGALLITVVRALDEAGQFNEETHPDLESCLMRLSRWGDEIGVDLDCKFQKVVKGYGKKLFSARTDEEREKRNSDERAAYESFVVKLSKEERAKRGDRFNPDKGAVDDEDDEDDEDEDEDEDEEVDKKKKGKKKSAWYGKAKPEDISYNHPSLKITPVWKAYKSCIANSPRLPLRGPPTWDLTKWSADDKKDFSFDSMDAF